MIKNTIIGILIAIVLSFLYILVMVHRGEGFDKVDTLDKTPEELVTYSSKNFGISFDYPKSLKVEETVSAIKVSDEKVNIVLTNKKDADLADYIKWGVQTYSINEVTADDTKHIVIRKQTASPESSDTHLFIENYPDGLADTGSHKHIVIAETSEDLSGDGNGLKSEPETVNSIMNSLRFVK